jgi:hypothetical protein
MKRKNSLEKAKFGEFYHDDFVKKKRRRLFFITLHIPNQNYFQRIFVMATIPGIDITVFKDGGETEVLRFKQDWTCGEAEKKIRENSRLEGGRLVDGEDCALRDDEHLGNRELKFVGGRSSGDFIDHCQFNYTHVPCAQYLSSHFSYSSVAFRKIAQAGGGQLQGGLLCHGVVRRCV